MTTLYRHWLLSPCCLGFVLAMALLGAVALAQQPDQAAMVLDSARRASNEKNYPLAVQRYREYLQKFAGNKEANQARYGLALALIEGPTREYGPALEQLNPLAGSKEFPELPYVLYYQGLCNRGLGNRALAVAEAKPQEANQQREMARQKFEEASKQFTAALTALTLPRRPTPTEADYIARTRCDLAEMQLRTGKPKDALATVTPLLRDKALAQSRHRGLGLYYHGFASFVLGDFISAGRSLSKLEPFSDPVYGTHTRYLLARIHHQDNERQEAAAQYQQVIEDQNRLKMAAVEALKQPDNFKNDPEEKARLEALARGVLPDYVARALLYLGVMQYEDGKFAEALAQFKAYQTLVPTGPLTAEARLREGFCKVQLKQFGEVQPTLEPLVDREPKLADQALFWIGKAQVGAIDLTKPISEIVNPLKTSIDTFRKAADRANQLVAGDPTAKLRRGEILAEMADTMQLAHLYKEAAATYASLLTEKLLPTREEELTLSLATALQLAGDSAESDKVCAGFQTSFPRSVLLPAILFRSAENAYFSLQKAEKQLTGADRQREVTLLADVVIKRYQGLIDTYPEFPQVNLARYGMALAYYRKGDLEKVKTLLEAIPVSERVGPLAVVSYQLADCQLRLAPTKADNAITAGQLDEALKAVVENLEAFINASPNSPQTADAMLKLGTSLQRQAALLAQPPEKQKVLAASRSMFEQLMQRFPKSDQFPQAVMERARVMNLQGDGNGAVNELRRFQNDPLKNSTVAPLALLQLGTLLRAQNKAPEAVDALARCRQTYEAKLVLDPLRSSWVPLLQLHHGLALREAGKRPEAQAVFDQLIKQFMDRPEAIEAALRSGQCSKDEAQHKIDEAQKRLANQGLKPEEKAQAVKALDQAAKEMRDAATALSGQAERLKEKQADSPVRARMLYEAAWGQRGLAALEIAAARDKKAREMQQTRREELMRKLPQGQAAPAVPLPEVSLTMVPVQPAETAARILYQDLITAFADLPLSIDARFELAEMLSERNELEPAIKLLREASDKEPAPDLMDKIRLCLGSCLQAKGDRKGAQEQFQAVVQNPKSGQFAQALFRSGECLFLAGDYAEAAKRLSRFRDDGAFQNLPGLTDRALFRLGQSLEKQKQFDASRQAHEQVVNRFPGSPLVTQSRFGIGWAFQNQQQYDNAINVYGQVVNLTGTEVGARAQMNIGMCRLAQKRYAEASNALLVVPITYDYPELNALSLLEAARALAEDKKKDQAIKVLERLLRDHPETEQAELAKKRLGELKKG